MNFHTASIEAKLSSVRTMSAAPLATSVPAIPIATPMSACFNAGASLTPSPVMATTLPGSCRALTRRSFCSGATRAKTCVFSAKSGRSASRLIEFAQLGGRMVACDHFNLDPSPLTVGYRINRLRSRWVYHSLQTENVPS